VEKNECSLCCRQRPIMVQSLVGGYSRREHSAGLPGRVSKRTAAGWTAAGVVVLRLSLPS